MILILERIFEGFDSLFDFFLSGGRELFFCTFKERLGVIECFCGFSSKLGFGFFIRDRLRFCLNGAVSLVGRAFSGVCLFLRRKCVCFLSHGVLHKR